MTELEKLRKKLEDLKSYRDALRGASPSFMGEWLLEIGTLNLAIAELMLKHE